MFMTFFETYTYVDFTNNWATIFVLKIICVQKLTITVPDSPESKFRVSFRIHQSLFMNYDGKSRETMGISLKYFS